MPTNHAMTTQTLAAPTGLPVAAAEKEAAYYAALKLVDRIDSDLRLGCRHYYDRRGKPLRTLDQVIRAILADTLVTAECAETEVALGMAQWMPA